MGKRTAQPFSRRSLHRGLPIRRTVPLGEPATSMRKAVSSGTIASEVSEDDIRGLQRRNHDVAALRG